MAIQDKTTKRIYKIALDNDLVPPKNSKYKSLKKISIRKRKQLCTDIIELVRTLHQLNIMLFDVNEEIFVVNESTNIVYIANLPYAQFITDIVSESHVIVRAKQIEIDEVLYFCGDGAKPAELDFEIIGNHISVYIND